MISRDTRVSKKRKQPPINFQMWYSKFAPGFVPPARDKDLPELSFETAIRFLLTDPPMTNGEIRIIRTTEDLLSAEILETIDSPNVVQILSDLRQTIECTIVLLAIIVAPANRLGIKTSVAETIGEEDRETLNVEALRSVIKRVMATGDIEGIVPTTG